TEYYEKVTSCVNHNPNIIIENRYLCDEEFFDIHSKAKKILFIYNGPSVLNSGALIKSLSTGREIIGPNRGAFVDYKNLGLIETFNTFDDIIELVETQPLENTTRLFNLKKSIETNSWELFGEKIKKAILTD